MTSDCRKIGSRAFDYMDRYGRLEITKFETVVLNLGKYCDVSTRIKSGIQSNFLNRYFRKCVQHKIRSMYLKKHKISQKSEF